MSSTHKVVSTRKLENFKFPRVREAEDRVLNHITQFLSLIDSVNLLNSYVDKYLKTSSYKTKAGFELLNKYLDRIVDIAVMMRLTNFRTNYLGTEERLSQTIENKSYLNNPFLRTNSEERILLSRTAILRMRERRFLLKDSDRDYLDGSSLFISMKRSPFRDKLLKFYEINAEKNHVFNDPNSMIFEFEMRFRSWEQIDDVGSIRDRINVLEGDIVGEFRQNLNRLIVNDPSVGILACRIVRETFRVPFSRDLFRDQEMKSSRKKREDSLMNIVLFVAQISAFSYLQTRIDNFIPEILGRVEHEYSKNLGEPVSLREKIVKQHNEGYVVSNCSSFYSNPIGSVLAFIFHLGLDLTFSSCGLSGFARPNLLLTVMLVGLAIDGQIESFENFFDRIARSSSNIAINSDCDEFLNELGGSVDLSSIENDISDFLDFKDEFFATSFNVLLASSVVFFLCWMRRSGLSAVSSFLYDSRPEGSVETESELEIKAYGRQGVPQSEGYIQVSTTDDIESQHIELAVT
ncbi:hypothetical protein HOG98_06155 [bacterium]|jgi:hypothetical protein|nr:hypothetical protein [bacterium]